LEGSDYNAYLSVKELNNLRMANGFVDSIYLYYSNSDTMYGSAGECGIQRFCKMYFPDMQYDSFYNMLNNVNSPQLVTPKGNPDNYVTFLFPISYGAEKTHGTVVFLIETSNLNELVKTIELSTGGTVLITYLDENLAASDNFTAEEFSELASAIRNITNGNNLKIKNNEYIINYLESEKTSLRLYVIVPKKIFNDKIASMHWHIAVVFIFVFLVGALAIYWFMRLNYNPIEKIILSINDMMKSENKNVKSIASDIKQVHSINEQLKKKVNRDEPILRQQILQELLKGKINDIHIRMGKV
jgi:hypothetical protein